MGSTSSTDTPTNGNADSRKSAISVNLDNNIYADSGISVQDSADSQNGGQEVHTASKLSDVRTPLLFLMVENLSTRNIGPLIRTASALGCTELLIVGSKKFSTHGAHASKRRLRVAHFWHWPEAMCYVQSLRQNCRVYGLHHLPFDSTDFGEESSSSSIALNIYAFPPIQQDTIVCFVLGQERQSLQAAVRAIVDIGLHLDLGQTEFQMVMKYETVLGIVLNRFVTSMNAQWIATHGECLFPTLSFENEKYAVDCFDPHNSYKVITVSNEDNDNVDEEDVEVGNLFQLPE